MFWFKVADDEFQVLLDKFTKHELLNLTEESKLLSGIERMVRGNTKVINNDVARILQRSYDELVNDVVAHLWEKLNQFDPSKGNFTTFAYWLIPRYLENEQKFYEAQKRIPPSQMDSIHETIRNVMEDKEVTLSDVIHSGEPTPESESIAEEEVVEFMNKTETKYGEKARQMLEYKLQGYTWREIGDMTGAKQPELMDIKVKLESLAETEF